MTKFKSQALHIIRINAGGSVYPTSFNPALLNIGILLHKLATQTKHFEPECNPYIVKYMLKKSHYMVWNSGQMVKN